jgi:hypothetical protein
MAELRSYLFDRKMSQKGADLLDEIFTGDEEGRNNVAIKSPRFCKDREVTFVFRYNSKRQAQQIVGTLTKWLSENASSNLINGIMLY